jgi:hypothetical protein
MNKNREQREAELRNMLATPAGATELLAIFGRHAGVPAGGQPPAGPLLVDTILNFEFPQDEGRPAGGEPGVGASTAAREGPEPGDKKFNDPPGAESPGG